MSREPMRKRSFVKDTEPDLSPGWERDELDPGWFYSAAIGAVRSARSYKPGGWWFLPAWLPDTAGHDVGPFPTRATAFAAAAAMAHRADER
jgi:hypothetical protein